MKLENIRAEVSYDWRGTKNVKFQPLDKVNLEFTTNYDSSLIRDREGEVGKVVAVSVAGDGKIRGKSRAGRFERAFTRYYVEFADGEVFGIRSHQLRKVT